MSLNPCEHRPTSETRPCKMHKFVVNNQAHQEMVNITVYITCAFLIPLTILILVKSLMMKERVMMLSISSLLLVGEVFGIVGTYYLQELWSILENWQTLFSDLDILHRYGNLTIYSFAFFFGSF